MRMLFAATCFALAAVTLAAAADDVSVLASGSTEGALRQIVMAPDVPRATFQFETSQSIARRLAARELPDVLIAQATTVDQAIKDGIALADTRASLGRIGIGVAAGPGAPPPGVADPDALKAALLAADLVVISQGASGASVERMLATLGVADRVTGKIAREPRGDDVMKRLAGSPGRAIGFTMISEIKLGERHGAR